MVLPDQPGTVMQLGLGHFQQQFIMKLEQYPAGQPGLFEAPGHGQHGFFDDVGGGTLERGVHRAALGLLADQAVAAADLGETAASK